MNECKNYRPRKLASNFLNIKRHTKEEDNFSKKRLVYSLIIFGIYAVYLFIGWKAGWNMFTLGDFIALEIFLVTWLAISFLFFQPNDQRESFLSGIKIYGNGEEARLSDLICELADFGATIVDSGEEADYKIDKFRDKYRVFEDLGARLIFSIRIDFYDHDTEIVATAIAMAINTLRRQRD